MIDEESYLEQLTSLKTVAEPALFPVDPVTGSRDAMSCAIALTVLVVI